MRIRVSVYRFSIFAGVLLFACSTARAADPPASSASYFSHTRTVTISAADKQNYITLDEAIFQHLRADLGDLRLYTSQHAEVPYAIVTERGSTASALSTIPVLNKGVVNGNTQFAVDVGVPEYDNVRFDLATKDFIAQVKLEGENELTGKSWSDLGTFTIFDFTKEKLGSNSSIRLRSPSRFRFLRITIVGPVSPQDVKGAAIADLQQEKAKYVDLAQQPTPHAEGKKTVLDWESSDRVPLDRIHFEVDPAEVNFNRPLILFCGRDPVGSGELSRIHLLRKGRKIDSENMDLDLSGLRCKHYKLEIANGDDPALRIASAHPQMLERRLYFNPRGETALTLYYGDDKLQPPTYDYAKLFEAPEPSEVSAATLSPDAQNAAYTGRPDERPWSEKNPAVLWIAMIAAIGLLGAWALKGFKS